MPEDTTVVGDEQTAEQQDESLLKPSVREFPWLRAAGAAQVTLIAEYVLVALAFELGPSSLGIATTRERLLQYVFFVYNSHFVPTVSKVTGGTLTGSPYKNILLDFLTADVATSIPPELFFAMPVVLLVATGWLFERFRSETPAEGLLEQSALVGTGIAVGYFATGMVGVFVFVRRITFDGGFATESPDLLWGFVAFLLFPLVFATLGALLAGYNRSRRQRN